MVDDLGDCGAHNRRLGAEIIEYQELCVLRLGDCVSLLAQTQALPRARQSEGVEKHAPEATPERDRTVRAGRGDSLAKACSSEQEHAVHVRIDGRTDLFERTKIPHAHAQLGRMKARPLQPLGHSPPGPRCDFAAPPLVLTPLGARATAFAVRDDVRCQAIPAPMRRVLDQPGVLGESGPDACAQLEKTSSGRLSPPVREGPRIGGITGSQEPTR
jgi:hypothetical protein